MEVNHKAPHFDALARKGEEMGFDMPSDVEVGTLLRTLVASKPAGNFLELGTGIGLSMSWMVDGMDDQSHLISIDNDPKLTEVVTQFFRDDPRVEIQTQDGGEWIENYRGMPFDLIFADAWPGKYSHLQEAFDLLKPGGIYVVDDMMPQPNWPEGHEEKAAALSQKLRSYPGMEVCELSWSTGVMLLTKVG